MTDPAVTFLRWLASTASSEQAAGAYLYAAEAIERGEHLKEIERVRD